jgi:hypothetical protein
MKRGSHLPVPYISCSEPGSFPLYFWKPEPEAAHAERGTSAQRSINSKKNRRQPAPNPLSHASRARGNSGNRTGERTRGGKRVLLPLCPPLPTQLEIAFLDFFFASILRIFQEKSTDRLADKERI